jgi:large subunit ribosomal protein L13
MLPKNRLGRRLYRKLNVYAGPDHPHQSQQPQPMEVPEAAFGAKAS